MEQAKVQEIRGAISSIDVANRKMLVKDGYITYPFKWTAELDVTCGKQKPGWRVVVQYFKDEEGGGTIKSIKYDEEYQKAKDKAAAVEQRLILLQSCLRTGASVYAVTNPIGTEGDTFDDAMDKIVARAVKDAATLLAEARKG